MWNSIVQFFQSLTSKPTEPTQISVSTLASWAAEHKFVHQASASSQLHHEYDHLQFFQQGSDHLTIARMSKQNPDDATVIADCTVHLDDQHMSIYCYVFENTGISLPNLHLVKRDSTLFNLLRGSSLSPISLPSNLSATHSALCEQAQWGDRVFKSEEVKDILSKIDTSTILWMESNDSHVLLVTTEYSNEPIHLGRKVFRHFATFRYKKSGRS